MKALIDMDLVVYRVGAACDNWHYVYSGQRFDSHKELKTYLKRQFTGHQDRMDQGLADAERKRDPEEWVDVRDSVVSFIEDLIEDYDEYQGYISGKGNFRYQLATILPYKGNRSSATRPHHYDAIRQLLVDAYDAYVAAGMEADDMLGLHQTEDTIICTLDKDLDVVPGAHWNWDRDKRYVVEELQAYKNFFKQLLTGDSTDNIMGLYGVGKQSQLLKKIDQMEDVEEMKIYVTEQYKARFGGHYELFLKENAQLLWILQSKLVNPFDDSDYWNVN